jgi:hypothetical protein
MAISEFSSGPSRRRIGFARDLPSAADGLLKQRGYECYLATDAELKVAGALATTDSLIISQEPAKPSWLKRDLERFAVFLDYDCRIYVRFYPEPDALAVVLDTLAQLRLPPSGVDQIELRRFAGDWFDPLVPLLAPFVHLLRADADWNPLANAIGNNPAGRPPSSNLYIKIHATGEVSASLTPERELLLKRAFSDCSLIELFPKTDGMSGVDAFEAFAHRSSNVVGSPAPYRCFVKLGPRVKVAREFQKYQDTALENVPFHLGPRLRAERCVLGKSQGLITCDYVAGAETLRDCIRDGRGVHVIGNLFNHTLISWRRAASFEERPLQDFLNEYLSERDVIPSHREHLIRSYGAAKTVEELKALLLGSPSSQPVLVGVIHGDLHATNVLVRMNDAVIIDLERITTGPLLLDAASLEGGLFVDGFVGDRRTAKEVLASLQPYFTEAAFGQDDHHCSPSNRSAWFVDSLRQVRMQARQMERRPHQYGWTLAAVLLKKSLQPNNLTVQGAPVGAGLTREQVRAMAFALAEGIMIELSKQGGAVTE